MSIICKKCGATIPHQKLFCQKCGTEVRLVPDFDSYDMHKGKEGSGKGSLPGRFVRRISDSTQIGGHLMTYGAIILLIIISAGGIAYGAKQSITKKNLQDPDYLLTRAKTEFEAGHYGAAREYAKKASECDPDSDEIRLFYADVLNADGAVDEAIVVLKEMIAVDDCEAAYRKLIPIYQSRNDNTGIAQLIAQTGNLALYREYEDYVADEPDLSLTDGETYLFGTRLEILAESGEIYYTTDGSKPDENSVHYEEPILLDVGTVRISSVTINSYGVHSAIVSGVFTVEAPKTAATDIAVPEPTPAARSYTDETGGSSSGNHSGSSGSGSGNNDREYSYDREEDEEDDSRDYEDPRDPKEYHIDDNDYDDDYDDDEGGEQYHDYDEDDDWNDALPFFESAIAE